MNSLMLQLLLLMSIAVCPLHGKGVPRTKGAGNRGSGSNRNSGRYGSTGSSGYSSLPLLIRSRFSYLAKFTAYRLGIILVSREFRSAHPDYSDTMTLCYSVRHDLPDWLYDSMLQPWRHRNRTVLGLHVCPLDSQPDKVYCCGLKDGQQCCTFWDDFSRLSSVVIGSILAVMSSFLFAAWLYRWSWKQLRWKFPASHSQADLLGDDISIDYAVQWPQAGFAGSSRQHQPQQTRKIGARRMGHAPQYRPAIVGVRGR